jgi:hypothetical protein
MAPALRAHPELIGLPFHVRSGVSHVHLSATPHAPNVDTNIAHKGILAQTFRSDVVSGFSRTTQ